MRHARPVRVMHVFANNTEVPYLSWFAQRAKAEGGIHFIFIILYTEPPRMLEEMRAHGFDIHWVRFDPEHRKRSMLTAVPKLWRYMRQYKPDVVHGHLFDDTLPAMTAAWLARTPMRLYTRQDTGFHWNYTPRWVFLDRLNAWLATRIVAVSQEGRAFMTKKERIDPAKITVIHHGVPPAPYEHPDPGRILRLRERFGLGKASPVVGTLARFIEWKGYRHIVAAAAILVKEFPKARFLFTGGGPQQDEVRRWVGEAGLEENVIITGWVDRADVPALYALMDVYLHAADHEPFGFVFAEAMFSSVPVVSTATGAALDAITSGVNGILVKERTGVALAEGVRKLFQAEAAAIGRAGHATATELYTFDRMWADYRRLYESAVQQ